MRRPFLGIFLSLFLISAGASYAETVVFQNGLNGYTGTQDTYITKSDPHKDYGNSIKLKLQNNKSHVLLYFDLSSIDTSQLINVNSATLSFYKYIGPNDPYSISVYRITKGPWTEGGSTRADWKHRVHSSQSWTVPGLGEGLDYTTDGSAVNNNVTVFNLYDFDVTDIVKHWLNNDNTNYGFLIKGSGDGIARWLASSENIVCGPAGPKLTIDYNQSQEPVIPEPGTLLLLGLGLFGLVGLRRKRRI